jgi:hypothetical protein
VRDVAFPPSLYATRKMRGGAYRHSIGDWIACESGRGVQRGSDAIQSAERPASTPGQHDTQWKLRWPSRRILSLDGARRVAAHEHVALT